MNISDTSRDLYMLKGPLAKKGYDWWWHNFTAYHKETGEEKAFFIEYFVCNPALGGEVPVLGQLKENQAEGVKPSYALIKVGTWGKDARQIHNFYSIKQFSCPKDKLEVKIGDCTLTENYMVGSCQLTPEEASEHPEYMCDSGKVEWDLKIDKQIAFHVGYGASPTIRSLNAFEMFWHAEGMKTQYSGTVILDGETYQVIPERSYGYADKNWGSDFTSPWLWISSCHMKSLITDKELNHSAIEIGGGRPKIAGIPLDRKILIGMFYEGTMFEYNFSKPWTGAKVKFAFEEGENYNIWRVKAQDKYSYLELKLQCKKEEMLFINYEAPDGKKRHNRLWNGGTGFGEVKLYEVYKGKKTIIDYISIKNVGCEYGEYSD